MIGTSMRCRVCNKYLPDRCVCNGASIEQQRATPPSPSTAPGHSQFANRENASAFKAPFNAVDEREAFEAWWDGRGLPDNLKAAFFMVWKAALASRPAEVDDEGLPPMPATAVLNFGVRGYTAEQFRQGQRDAVAADRAQRGANDEAVLLLREALPHISPSAVNVAIARSGPMHEAFVNTRIRKYLEQVSAPSHTTIKEK